MMGPDGRQRGMGRWFRWLSLFLGLIALGYVAAAASQSWSAGQVPWESISARGLLLAFGANAVGLFLLAYAWHFVLSRLGVRTSLEGSLYAWFTSNLYKYVPGQIWAPVGRVVIGAKLGVPARAAVLTVGLEHMFSLLSAAFVLLAGLGKTVPAALVALASLALAHPRAANFALTLMDRFLRRPVSLVPLRWPQLIFLLVVVYSSLGLSLLALAAVLLSLGLFEFAQVHVYAVALTGSLLAGMVFFGAPAGLGVREGVMLAVLTQAGMAKADGATATLLLRVISILAEAACFSVGAALLRLRAPHLGGDT